MNKTSEPGLVLQQRPLSEKGGGTSEASHTASSQAGPSRRRAVRHESDAGAMVPMGDDDIEEEILPPMYDPSWGRSTRGADTASSSTYSPSTPIVPSKGGPA